MIPKCPQCQGEYVYEDNFIYICPECSHEFTKEETETEEFIVKDLKVKGSSNSLKIGTKVKNIRLVQDSDHNIDCKIDGFGAMSLKSEFVKKIN